MTDAIKEGRVAARILSDKVFKKAVERADAQFIAQWRDAETVGEREQAHALQAALQQVIIELETIVGRGEVAESRQE